MNTFAVPKCIETSILALDYVRQMRAFNTTRSSNIFCFWEKVLQYIFTSLHQPNYCKK